MTDNTQSDVVERLRAYKPYQISDGEPFGPKFCAQAADEIERLRSALASLSTKDSDGLEPTCDEIFGIINIVTDLYDAEALDKAYPEVFDRLQEYGKRLTALTSSDAVLEERERCARIADSFAAEWNENRSPFDAVRKDEAEGIAAAIRKGDNA